ncbi:adenylate/guanylate cyclase domain-containing protein [Mariprofundus ferrooxydans]|uniref:Adenylate/guanylate cyclase catalytic domain protein n=1 Tax=Mariprofundus ferrooxydans PV-1 TaxID=314345 RepID=Q0EXI4_9PROT|nr:adenylate/guanylate cyclase domain-containing protein [Mariprofundus ferrooxydans]EAU53932.1 adenylate/guanylate cyclase catalytic domain protein [Mariprofundus ferrooxydans PV-1]KON47117.1 guanylate cyclase [Mariprofundus ferrooxydans]
MHSNHSTLPIQMFLPSETVELIAEYGSDFPHNLALEQDMTILFSDMRDFTELAERFEPREVYASINASIALQVKSVHAYGGSVNKFLGDGLLACFSGEGKSERAVACAAELLRVLPEHEGALLPCRIGFGINSGKIMFGVLGDAMRWEYTVVGDVANTAARLCGIAKPFQALVTESVFEDMSPASRQKYCSFLRPQMFKGKKHPVGIYEVRAESDDDADKSA